MGSYGVLLTPSPLSWPPSCPHLPGHQRDGSGEPGPHVPIWTRFLEGPHSPGGCCSGRQLFQLSSHALDSSTLSLASCFSLALVINIFLQFWNTEILRTKLKLCVQTYIEWRPSINILHIDWNLPKVSKFHVISWSVKRNSECRT